MFASTTVVSVRITSPRSIPSSRAERTRIRWIFSHVAGWIRFTLAPSAWKLGRSPKPRPTNERNVGVLEVEAELLLREAVDLLEQRDPQDLIAVEPAPSHSAPSTPDRRNAQSR